MSDVCEEYNSPQGVFLTVLTYLEFSKIVFCLLNFAKFPPPPFWKSTSVLEIIHVGASI